jgi:hypothetical protein
MNSPILCYDNFGPFQFKITIEGNGDVTPEGHLVSNDYKFRIKTDKQGLYLTDDPRQLVIKLATDALYTGNNKGRVDPYNKVVCDNEFLSHRDQTEILQAISTKLAEPRLDKLTKQKILYALKTLAENKNSS